MESASLDYSRYFWQGERVRLRPVRVEDAEDAVRILLRYGFWERRYQKCNSACVDTNEASIRLHEKLGFSEEGRRRRHWFLDGEYRDDVLFGLTREEFDALEKR